MNKKNNNTYILLFIIIILLLVIIYFLTKRNNKEYFDSSSSNAISLNFQSGTSGINPTGTITFPTPFLNPPLVFTQIISSSSNSTNSYSIQVLNITNNSFDYSKNKIYNSQTNTQTSSTNSSSTYSVTLMVPSTTESFIWLAIG